MEDGEWERPNRRRRNNQKKTANKFEFDNATTFLVFNLPGFCCKGDVWNEFQVFGDLVDVFIPRKADRGGNRFAFIRFENVKDMEKMLQVLNMVKLKGAKLSVTRAKFKRDGLPFEDVVTKQSTTNDRNEAPTAQHRGNGVGPESININNMPFRDVLKGGAGTSMKSFDTDKDSSSLKVWAKKSLLVETKDLNTLFNLKEVMKNVITYLSGIRYVGGLKVLLSFCQEQNCEAILAYYKAKPSTWFSNVTRWTGQDIPHERIAWLRLDGVPLQAWDTSVFKTIGSSFGKVLYPSPGDWKDCNLAYEFMGVLVTSGREIAEEVKIFWQGKQYAVWVNEVMREWVPDFLIGSQKLPMYAPANAIVLSSSTEKPPEHDPADDLEEGEVERLESAVMEVPLEAEQATSGTNNSINEETANVEEAINAGDEQRMELEETLEEGEINDNNSYQILSGSPATVAMVEDREKMENRVEVRLSEGAPDSQTSHACPSVIEVEKTTTNGHASSGRNGYDLFGPPTQSGATPIPPSIGKRPRNLRSPPSLGTTQAPPTRVCLGDTSACSKPIDLNSAANQPMEDGGEDVRSYADDDQVHAEEASGEQPCKEINAPVGERGEQFPHRENAAVVAHNNQPNIDQIYYFGSSAKVDQTINGVKNGQICLSGSMEKEGQKVGTIRKKWSRRIRNPSQQSQASAENGELYNNHKNGGDDVKG